VRARRPPWPRCPHLWATRPHKLQGGIQAFWMDWDRSV